MAITIEHTYCTHVEISFLDRAHNYALKEQTCGSMDEIAEHICEVLVKHNFASADVIDASTGELLMLVERS
jgi:hypothetical protein